MDNHTFFTSENKDLLYNLCKDELIRQTQYNIDNNKKYYKTFGEIMKIVYKHSENKNNMSELNKAVLGKTIPYLQQEINKKKLSNQSVMPENNFRNQVPTNHQSLLNNQQSMSMKQNQLPVSFRSESTSINNDKLEDVSKNYNKIMENRKIYHEERKDINFNDNNKQNYEEPSKLLEQQMSQRREMNQQFNIPDNQPSNQFIPNSNQGIDNNVINTINDVKSQTLPVNQEQQIDRRPQQLMTPPNNNNLNMNIKSNYSNTKVQDNKVDEQLQQEFNNLQLQQFDLSNNSLFEEGNLEALDTYNRNNDNVDPMKLYKKFTNQRSEEDMEYKKIQESRVEFEDANRDTNMGIDKVNLDRQIKKQKEDQNFRDSLSFKINNQMNDLNVEEIKSQLDTRVQSMENELNKSTLNVQDKNLSILQNNNIYEENKLYEEFKKKIFEERKYINRENLVCINSGDRNWYNEDSEHRYAFQVRFKPERDGKHRVPKMDGNTVMRNPVTKEIIYETVEFKGDQGCGIETIFKNIVSFELVRVLMPVENVIIPFDNRIFVDYKSLPYIVLKIDEIEGLYSGTNTNIHNSFAKLLWDKDHTSEVLIDSGLLDGDKKLYSRQLKRGYSSMAPMSFEKKTFYPSPLATLNRLTLSLQTPYGASIKHHPDVLTITDINFEEGDNLAVDEAPGFPYNTSQHLLKIVTQTYFSNRVFKIGDNIQIKNFSLSGDVTDSSIDLEAFINREEGHYIINLAKEVSEKEASQNEGYINEIYIPPPGDIDYSATSEASLLKNTAYDTGAYDTDKANSANCKLINKSLQTHFVFKIVTREDDMTSFSNSANI